MTKMKKENNEYSSLPKTSRLEGIGRVGSPAPMFMEQWYLLGKGHAMVEGVWRYRPKTIGRLGDIGFFTL